MPENRARLDHIVSHAIRLTTRVRVLTGPLPAPPSSIEFGELTSNRPNAILRTTASSRPPKGTAFESVSAGAAEGRLWKR
ncbi:hypothetical protein C791_5083 [Amycolatopsis azurea DSM 43854]|uniref:Uncharacterized protein n=1 Tax=Amycolatopsis azurea DSM 43854 TaxID=1238180 RepID=M2NRW7_9PSEU|nr:hypothetical protein C791_5083 [Amycolatopsis azurea DSM 43854]